MERLFFGGGGVVGNGKGLRIKSRNEKYPNTIFNFLPIKTSLNRIWEKEWLFTTKKELFARNCEHLIGRITGLINSNKWIFLWNIEIEHCSLSPHYTVLCNCLWIYMSTVSHLSHQRYGNFYLKKRHIQTS